MAKLSIILYFCFISLLFSSIAISYPNFESKNLLNEFAHQKKSSFIEVNVSDISENYIECKEEINMIFSSNINNPKFRPFIEFSGKKVNDLGYYHKCEDYDNMTYFQMGLYALNSPTPFLNIGICAPNVCTNNTLLQVIRDDFKFLIPFISTDESVSISMKHTSEYNKMVNKLSIGFYIVLIVMILFIILVLYSTNLDFIKSWLFKDSLKKKQSLVIKILNCFSLKVNIESLCKTENRIDPKLNVLHFLRCIGMFWVVAGHMFMFSLINNTYNVFSSLNQILDHTFMAIIRNGTVSVDMFFTLSGFLSTLACINSFENPKRRTLKNLLLFYFHRYVRLFPMIILAWALGAYLIPPIVKGIETSGTYINSQACKSRFLTTFLYLDNYFTSLEKFCNNWIWYLFIDMQLFILTPFIVLPLLINISTALITLLILGIASLGYQTFLFQSKNYSAFCLADNGGLNSDYYSKTYTRCNTYFVGMFFCYLYLEFKGKKLLQSSMLHNINILFTFRILRYFIVLLGLFFMVFVIFSQNYFDHSLNIIPQYLSTLFLLFDRILFVLGMMLLIYPSFLGYGRVIFSIFSHPFFHFIGKITYGTYILHILVIEYIDSNSLNGIYYEYYHNLIISFEIYFFCYILSFICTGIFESPVVQMLKLITQPSKKISRPKKDEEGLRIN